MIKVVKKISTSHFKNYLLIGLAMALSWFVSNGAEQLLHSELLEHGGHFEVIPVFLELIVIFALGFMAYELAKPTVLPSFVVAIFFGFFAQKFLSEITNSSILLSVLTTLGATLILFGGGLETPFNRFKSLFAPILSLAFLGTVLTAILYSFVLSFLVGVFGFELPLPAIILLGIALASTDPAAIIPSFKSLFFKQPRVKHMAISESALNDVIGALITGIFITLFALESSKPTGILESYASLLNSENLINIGKIILFGTVGGIVGYFILDVWSKWKEKMDSDGEADSALFFAVPILTYTLAVLLGGNGFLAVFVAGLLFQLKSHVQHVEHFFNHTIEGFMKPLIFMLLGALIEFESLKSYAAIGILLGLIFMFVIRPIAVFATLYPFKLTRARFSIKELIFLSFIRETGVIPAVLLVSIKLAGIPGSDIALSIGMWTILLTLVIQPPLTPWLAKKLDLATDQPSFPKSKHHDPIAVLCSRSYTFLERLNSVVSWADKHHLKNIWILHCAEEKYAPEFTKEVEEVANVKFKSINNHRSVENKPELEFKFVAQPGTLHENIESLANQQDVSIIFVGSKMLDFRMDQIKNIQAPFIFLD